MPALLEHYRIGELRLTLSKDPGARFVPVSDAMRAFAEALPGHADAVELRVHASVGPLPPLADAAPCYDRGSFWRAYALDGRPSFACCGAGANAGIWRVILGDASATSWQLITAPQPTFIAPGNPLPDPFAFPAAELIVLSYLATQQAAIMHACGVVDRADGYLFCGRSGAGKSTSAALWQHEARVLNDDRVLLQRDAHGDYRIHGTPWHGDFRQSEPGSAALRGIFFLEHGDEHRAERMSSAWVHRQLLTTCWLPLWDRARGLPQTIALCGQLAREVPGYRLRFKRDPAVIEVVRRAVADGGQECRLPEVRA